MDRISTIILKLIACICFVILFVSCVPISNIQVTFNIMPNQIGQGTEATLFWDVKGATEISIDNGIGEVPEYGKLHVSPKQTTAYTLTARNLLKEVSKTATLTVEIPPPPTPTATTVQPTLTNQSHPDDSYIEVSSYISHYVQRDSSKCEYEITIRNRHGTWAIRNVTLKINDTTYKVADHIKPYDNAVFFKILECPYDTVIYDYEWVEP